MGPVLVLLYAVGAGSSAVAGEEDRRTLDLLLTTPVTRSRVVVDKALAMVAGTLGLAALLGLALVAEGALAGMDLPAGNVAAAMLHLALLGLVFGSMSLAIGAATGRLGLSRGIPVFLAVVTYVVNGLGGLVDWLTPAQKLSPFYQYAAHDPLRNGVSLPAVAVAVATVVVLVVVAVVGFDRRDIAS
jgi:ABC-2 type transport system permease protein